jgi:hypothetical protein
MPADRWDSSAYFQIEFGEWAFSLERLSGCFRCGSRDCSPKRIPKAEPWVSLSAFSAHTEKASLPRLEGQAVRQHKYPLRRSRRKKAFIYFGKEK